MSTIAPQRQNLRIVLPEVELDAWLFRSAQADDGPLPCIVMSPGFAALKAMHLDRLAERFAAAGFAVLLYDHRNFGASGGERRGEIDPWRQVEDMRELITWLATQAWADAARIGLWGSSYSGGHAITLGALDRRLRCVVAQVPTISGYQSFLRRAGERVHSLCAAFQADRLARLRGEAPAYRRVIAEAGEAGIYPGAEAEAFYGVARSLPERWENRVTLRSSERASEYEPGLLIERVSPTPLLMLVAERDTVTPTDLALAAYQRALQPKRLVLLPGGHFDPYTVGAAQAGAEALAWFERHLRP